MDKIQKIKEEIERRLNLYESQFTGYESGRKDEAESILDFIDSLPEESKCIYNRTLDERKKFCKYCSAACDVRIEEEPVSEDLEEEIERWIKKKHFIFTEIDEIIETARHFAEWQHGKDFDDLLQSEMKFPKEYYEKGKADAMKEMKEALQTEYEKSRFDMREEMMKNAVECVVEDWCGDSPEITIPLNPQDFKMGDKVKIIIVKEEK